MLANVAIVLFLKNPKNYVKEQSIYMRITIDAARVELSKQRTM
jgi:hypothetical protein